MGGSGSRFLGSSVAAVEVMVALFAGAGVAAATGAAALRSSAGRIIPGGGYKQLGAGRRAAKGRLSDEGEAKNYSLREVFHASPEDITVTRDAQPEYSPATYHILGRFALASWPVFRAGAQRNRPKDISLIVSWIDA